MEMEYFNTTIMISANHMQCNIYWLILDITSQELGSKKQDLNFASTNQLLVTQEQEL